MNRLALTAALASAAVGSGCIVNTCTDQTLTVDWTFTSVTGVPNRTCSEVGVAYVDIFLDGSRVVNAAPCLDYRATIFNVSQGSHQVTVEGLDAGLAIIDRDMFSTSVGSCGDTSVVARPAESLLSFDYHFAPSDTCSGGFMWYSLFDVVANKAISAIPNSNVADDTRFVCPALVQFPVPLGTYRLDWMQRVTFSSGLARYVAIDQICTPTSFDVSSTGTTTIPVTLGVATSSCGAAAP